MLGIAGGLGIDRGGPLSSITDLFNGFNRVTGDSYTGGPTTVLDHSGALVTAPVNRMGIEGGRLSYSLAEGATLGPELFTGNLMTGAGLAVTNADATHIVTFGYNGGLRYQSDTTSPALTVSQPATLILSRMYRVVPTLTVASGALKTDMFGTSDVLVNGVPITKVAAGTAISFTRNVANTDATVMGLSVKEVIPIWLPYASNGSPIASSQSVRTRRGVVQKYASPYRGFLNEPARTNKVTARKHNPTDTTNVTKSGDAAAVLSVVDDTAALTAAGLIGICTNGKVYKLDNSAGVTDAFAELSGTCGNTNAHVASAFVRGTGTAGVRKTLISGAGEAVVALTANYQRKWDSGSLPAASSLAAIRAAAGAVVYFILPQLGEGSFVTSTIPGDTLATVTRAATVYSRPSEGRLRPNTQGIAVRVFPSAAGQTGVLWSTRVDANNYAQISATPTTLVFSKTIAGVTTSATVNYTHSANTPFIAMAHQDPVGGMKVRVKQDGGAWAAYGTNASVVDMPIGSSYHEGTLNGLSHFSGNFPYVELVQAGLSAFEAAIQ